MRNYQDEIRIDLSSLEDDLKNQAEYFLYWAEQHANAITERDKLKQRIDVKRAELDAEIRKNWERYGFEKAPTENAIINWIVRHFEFIELNQELIEATRRVNIYSASEKAFDQRKHSLKPLADLYIAGYWAKPKVSEKLKDELGAAQRRLERQEVVNEKLTKFKLKRKEKE